MNVHTNSKYYSARYVNHREDVIRSWKAAQADYEVIKTLYGRAIKGVARLFSTGQRPQAQEQNGPNTRLVSSTGT